MSFVAPLWLFALLLVPALLLAQRYGRRRARRYALRYTAVASVLAAAAELTPRSRARAWVPLTVLVLGVACVGVALARPQVKHRVPSGNASVILVLDHSGSMAATDVSPSRIAAAIKAGNTFIDQLPPNVKVGIVGFGSTADAAQQPVSDHDAARQLLDSQQANGGTATGPALQLALQLLHGADRNHPPSAIVLLSDGAANEGSDPVTVAAQAKQEGIAIDTVALGTANGVLQEGPYQSIPVPPDPQLMQQIAKTSGGRSFDAETADQLSSIYKSLGSKLGSAEAERDITLWPLIIGALLLIGGVVLSTRSRAVAVAV